MAVFERWRGGFFFLLEHAFFGLLSLAACYEIVIPHRDEEDSVSRKLV